MLGKSLVYLDANVLIPSVTRGLLIIGAVSSDFRATDNIKDFGTDDLTQLSISVVTPDLFLSTRLEELSYLEVLMVLTEGRTREPRTPAGIHGREVAPQLPALAAKFASTLDVALDPPTKRPMTEVFRGRRCVRCESVLSRSGQPLCELCQPAAVTPASVC